MIHYEKQNWNVHLQIWTFIVVKHNLLYVSTTDCGHFQGGVLWELYYLDLKTIYKYKYQILNLSFKT
jgi:hypothetical protein